MSRISVYLLAGAAAILFAANVGHAQTPLPIGINIAADAGSAGSMTGEQPEQLPAADTAGVVPISNWNNLVIDRFTTAQTHSSSALPTGQNPASSAIPFTLSDSSATATTAQVTAWTGGDSYSVYGTAGSSPDQQLMNGLLGSKKTGGSNSPQNASLTISSIPAGYISAGYDVYVYYNNNNAVGSPQDGVVTLTSGSFTSATYDVATVGQVPLNGDGTYPYTEYNTATNTVNVFNSTNYYVSNYLIIPVPAGGASSFQVSFAEPNTGNPGITAIEIVPVPEPSSLALLLFATVPTALLISRRLRADQPRLAA